MKRTLLAGSLAIGITAFGCYGNETSGPTPLPAPNPKITPMPTPMPPTRLGNMFLDKAVDKETARQGEALTYTLVITRHAFFQAGADARAESLEDVIKIADPVPKQLGPVRALSGKYCKYTPDVEKQTESLVRQLTWTCSGMPYHFTDRVRWLGIVDKRDVPSDYTITNQAFAFSPDNRYAQSEKVSTIIRSGYW